MGPTLLSQIAPSVREYAAAISTVLGMDVDVADERMVRIAGTGRFAAGTGASIADAGGAFHHVLKSGRSLVVSQPGKDAVCGACAHCADCSERFEMCCPIVLEGKTLGIVSLAAFDETNYKTLLQKGEQYRRFLEQMAGFLSAKAAEWRAGQAQLFAASLQAELLQHISDGVLVFDRAGKLLQMNRKAEDVLGNNELQLRYLHKIGQFSLRRRARAPGGVEYTLRMRARQMTLTGREYPLTVRETQAGRVFVFQHTSVCDSPDTSFHSRRMLTLDLLDGSSPAFLRMREEARALACTTLPLLLCGESGTGRQTLARAIHQESCRSKPFICVDGWSKNAAPADHFWHALSTTAESSDFSGLASFSGCTVLIQQTEKLPLHHQALLARLIQSPCADMVRLIFSASPKLREDVRRGDFCVELYDALVLISLPPLRERPGDVPLLLQRFLEQHGERQGKDVRLTAETTALLNACRWPGNLRQLDQVAALCVGTQRQNALLDPADLPAVVRKALCDARCETQNLEQTEQRQIFAMLDVYGRTVQGKRRAARELGISVATLYRRLARYADQMANKQKTG